MESSILTSTKKTLGIAEQYVVFDQDILLHINAAFSTLHDLGIGAVEGIVIEDAEQMWEELDLSIPQLGMVKAYIFLKVRLGFDPPQTSFLIEAIEKQIEQYEWRLSVNREATEWVDPNPPKTVVEEPVW